MDKYWSRKWGRIKWVIAFLVMSACVERINFDIPAAGLQTVVEGMITDAPGPYSVKLSRGLSLDADTLFNPISGAVIELFDEEGSFEYFTESTPGIYKTGGVIQGQQGHSYHIRVVLTDGTIFESQSEIIHAPGNLQDITYAFEKRTTVEPWGENEADVFKIYVNGNAASADKSYLRWRFTGTFQVDTYPQAHTIQYPDGLPPVKDPLPCSGWIVLPALGGGNLSQVGPCTCCTCWITQYEPEPSVSDGQFVTNNQFRDVKVAEVPINTSTFHEKYIVEIEQMSLTQDAYDFYKLIRAQKEGASSLFQPPSGEIKGNMKIIKSAAPVIGLFWATSIVSKFITIPRSAVPYKLTKMDSISDDCTHFKNSTNTKPIFW